MQKAFNACAVLGLTLAAIHTALIVVAVVRGPDMANKVMSEVELKLTTILFDKLGSSVEDAMPSQVQELMPSEIGPALPF